MKILNKFNNISGFVKGASMLAVGSILAQIIGFIGSMAMTRLYTKEAIGIMTVIVSVSNMFAGSINGRFDFAIVKEKKETNIFPLITLSLLVGVFFSAMVAFGSLLYFTTKDEIPSPVISSFFVFLMLIVTAFTNVFRSYNNRLADYKTMTWVIAIRKLAEEVSMVLFGFLKSNYITLLISRVIGQFFGMRQQTRHVRHDFGKIFKVKKDEIKEVYQTHCKQLYFSTPAAIMNSASYSLISVFVGELFGMGQVAVYSISMSVLGLPLSVISGNISKVYFAEASKEYRSSGCFRSSTLKTAGILIPLSIIMFIGMYWLIPLIVPYVYGSQYSDAGIFIKILAPMFAVRFVTSSMTTGLVVAGYQQVEAVLQSLFFLVAVFIYILCSHLNWTVHQFLGMLAIGYAIIYTIYLAVIVRVSSKKTKC